jgi:hypothetical protein
LFALAKTSISKVQGNANSFGVQRAFYAPNAATLRIRPSRFASHFDRG